MSIKSRLKAVLRPAYYAIMQPKVDKLCLSTYSRLQDLKNKYVGNRCFIVANGPSLRMEDLDRIKDEYSFGMNRIYMLFDRTEWRPTFYTCQDPSLIRTCHEEIITRVSEEKSICIIKPTGQKKYNIPDSIYIDVNFMDGVKRIEPGFLSKKKDYEFDDGLTSVYLAMQLAVYMGFSEIYLLGTDCNYSANNDKITENSYPDSRMYDPTKMGMPPQIESMFRAYSIARKYCEQHDIKIMNATRGGKLEVFKRIELDNLFVQ